MRTYYIVEDATGTVLNAVLWDGVAAYDLEPGQSLVLELDYIIAHATPSET